MTRRRNVRLLAVTAVLMAVAVLSVVLIGRSRPASSPTARPGESAATASSTSSSTTSAPVPSTVPTPAAPTAPPTVDPAAVAAVEAAGSAPVLLTLDVVPTGTDAERAAQVQGSLDRVLATLPAGSWSDAASGLTVGIVPVTVDRAGLDALASSTVGLTSVRATRTFQPVATTGSTPSVASAAPASTNATTTEGTNAAWVAGKKGSGATVAVIDTGVDATHPFLNATSKSIFEACFVTARGYYASPCADGVPMGPTADPVVGAATPCPVTIANCNHGTHVAGIAVGGTGTSGQPVSGIAPAADLVAINVFGYSTAAGRVSADDADIIRALQWLYTKRALFDRLSSVNLSLGDSAFHAGACDSDPLKPYVDQLAAVGVATVVAAGNDSWSNGVSSPACISTVMAVGAVDDTTGQTTSFSNDGPQVDVMAAGLNICSSAPTGAAGTSCPAPNGGTMRYLSGTSMSTPAIAGAIAVLRADGVAAADVRARLQRVATGADCVQASAYAIPSLRLDVALGLVGQRAAPCAPGAPTATNSGVYAATVSWLPPLAVGTGTLTSYSVQASTGQTCTATAPATSCAVNGTGPGPVTFTVRANSTTGTSGASVPSPSVNVGLPPGSPVGSVDVVAGGVGSLTVAGWVIDPDTAASTSVHVYVDGRWGGAFVANASRPDVAAVFPPYGSAHGFNGVIPISGGNHTVCVYGIDIAGSDPHVLLGCRSVSVLGGSPIGAYDGIGSAPGVLAVAGWVIDPDTAASTSVHVYVDGRWGGAFVANASRPDVAAVLPAYGPAHGFFGVIPASGGPHTACVYGIDIAGSDPHVLLGCRSVTVPGGSPFGSVDVVAGGVGSLTVAGWVIDPDTAASTSVHVYVDGQWGGAFVANASRPDVAAVLPAYGSAHGFNGAIAASVGSHSVCVYGIDIAGSNPHVLLGCRSATVR